MGSAEASDLDSGTVERKNSVARKVADCLPVKISFVKSLNRHSTAPGMMRRPREAQRMSSPRANCFGAKFPRLLPKF